MKVQLVNPHPKEPITFVDRKSETLINNAFNHQNAYTMYILPAQRY